jgi:potassium-transporting ATPase KdpC subunit
MLAALPTELLRSLRLTLVIAAVTGLIYPLAMTGIAQAAFNHQANGSLVTKDGQVVGSSLIGQQFTGPDYFHGRVSATVDASDPTKAVPYNADNSAGSNLGPSNQALIDRVSKDVQTVRTDNGLGPNALVPADLVTADFSGLDPDVSEASALLQVSRVAQARGLDAARVRALVERHVQGRVLWVFGEPHVNVLDVNMALDRGEAG